MKKILLTAAFIFLVISMAQASVRIKVPLNNGWMFSKGDIAGASEMKFNDADWEKVCLPHTWNNLDGQDGGTYYRGPVWYRKSFEISNELSTKKIYIRFGAANMITDVYVNGKFVGEHKGGYAAFIFDITNYLNIGKDNIVAVKVDNTFYKDNPKFELPPLDADFTMDGGMFRKVELIAVNDIHISMMDYASPGVFITQNKVIDELAELSILAKLKNDSKIDASLSIKTRIIGEDGKVIKESARQLKIKKGKEESFVQNESISNPHLWNGRIDPYLYKVVISVYQNKKLVDEKEQPLGLRYYRVDPETGFYLNGKPYKLHGVCLHEDKKDEGRALTYEDRKQEMNYLLDIGATMVRFAHYQYDQKMYRLCDKYGIVVWTEIPLVNHIIESEAFEENCKQQLLELIRQNYNHPSVFFWGMFNELGQVKGPDAAALVKDLNSLAKKEDPKRLTIAAANYDNIGPAFVTDVLGINKYFGWYNGKIQELGPYLDKWHKEHPERAIGLSEYGAGASIYQHEENPKQPNPGGSWHPEEYQAYYHEAAWKEIEARPYIWFSTLWNMFDFAVDSRREGFKPGINDKGLITQDHAVKKDAYYWYKVNWNPAPMVHITSKRFTVRDTSSISVKVYSNADEVELLVDGKSLGKMKSDDHRFIWNEVELNHGSNDVKAVAMINGKEYFDECWFRNLE